MKMTIVCQITDGFGEGVRRNSDYKSGILQLVHLRGMFSMDPIPLIKKMQFFRLPGYLDSCFDAQFFDDMLGVGFDGIERNEGLLRYLTFPVSACHEFEYFGFPGCLRERSRFCFQCRMPSLWLSYVKIPDYSTERSRSSSV
jgi:hypothetical protein